MTFLKKTFCNKDENRHFVEEIIKSHNIRRSYHGAPDLQENEELAERAQDWADKIARKGYVSFCEIAGVGENIRLFPSDLQPDAIVEQWYCEHEKYEYETPGWQDGTNAFTQMIWKSTKEIGVGRMLVEPSSKLNSPIASRRNKIIEQLQIVVVFYRPAGNNNREGLFSCNVLKPKFECLHQQ